MSITGSNNPFACEPVVFANTNAIVSLGTITRDGNEFTFSVGFVWKINGVIYQNTAPVVLTIAEASEGFTRIDNALLNTSNTIELQQGLESETIALKPVAPDTNIILTSWNISGTTIGDTEDPIIGTSFVKKSFFAPFISTVTGTDAIIPLDPNGYTEIRLTDASLTSIAGFDLSLITGVPSAEVPYNGKPYIIRNVTGNDITIKNELGAADYPFFLSGAADLVFPNGQAIYVLYDSSGFNEIFKSWNTLDETTDFGNTTTNDITTGKITTPMVRMPKGSFNVHIYPVELTANRKLEAPDKNGIIATLDDIPSNPITGTGTINKLPKFTGSGTLGNSQIFDNGTNLGIGTNTPNAKLDMTDVLRIQSSTFSAPASGMGLELRNIAGTSSLLSYDRTNDLYKPLVFDGYDFTIKSNGNNVIYLNSSGNVGIGTTSPAYKFHVNDTSDGIVGHFSGGVSNYTLISFKSNEPNVYSTSLGSYNSGMLFRTGATDRMYINSSGNVGIGTTSPTTKLHIIDASSSVNPSIKVTHDIAHVNQSIEVIGSAFDGGGIVSVDTTSNLIFKRGGSESMRIDGEGKVGIGTSSPNVSAILHLQSTRKGFLPPVMKDSERAAISSPAQGLMIFNSDTGRINVFDGDNWQTVAWA